MREAVEAIAGAASYLALRAAMPLMVRRLGLTGSLEALSVRPGRSSFATLLFRAERIADATPLLRRTCLYRNLSRYPVLRRAGHDVRFVMGVRRRDDDIEGHAWLEIDGVPNDETARDFTVTLRYPAAAP